MINMATADLTFQRFDPRNEPWALWAPSLLCRSYRQATAISALDDHTYIRKRTARVVVKASLKLSTENQCNNMNLNRLSSFLPVRLTCLTRRRRSLAAKQLKLIAVIGQRFSLHAYGEGRIAYPSV